MFGIGKGKGGKRPTQPAQKPQKSAPRPTTQKPKRGNKPGS
jgi:hypothetical protein